MRFIEGIGREGDHLVEDGVGSVVRNAVLPAPVDEVHALRVHDVVFLFRHGPPDDVRVAVRVARQLPADLHDLLLVDETAVGDIEDVLQLRRHIAHLGRVVAVADIGGDGVHGTGPVQRRDGNEVLQLFRLEADHDRLEARGLELEDPFGLPFPEHPERLRVVFRDTLHGKRRVALLYEFLTVFDDGQRAEPQEVHLEQAQLLQFRHGVLGDRGPVLHSQGHIGVHRVRRDDDAGGMGGGVPGHALYFQRVVDEFFRVGVILVEVAQLLDDLDRPLQVVGQGPGNEPVDRIDLFVRDLQHAADVAHRLFRGQGPEGDDLGHVVGAVLADDVVDDLSPALIAEVDVEVGHGYPLRVQEPLEEQVILHGVDIGDAHTVGGNGPRARTAPRADRDVVVLGIGDKVVDDEVIVRIPHAVDDREFVVEAFPVFRGDVFPVPFSEPGLRHGSEVIGMAVLFRQSVGVVFRDGEVRQLGHAELQFHIAPRGDALRVLQRLRQVGKEFLHLLFRLEIELLRPQVHARLFLQGMVRLDAE